ncbi:9526_t:CDS:1 [Racocetra fulgida]|uniref:9526_t:CDS:1 n=1 Tax=Racocetra fulgida TaxID=60492 RepID=A0A9N8WE00_9GLOM|nr:9526_t:CDS:1 [Racocetra fulgida]
MHSFLVENTKSELNYVNPNLRQEDFLTIFNKIASSIEDNTNLFSEKDLFSIQEESTEESIENTEEEPEVLDGENSMNLEVKKFINLLSKLELSELSSAIEEIVHGDRDFDINNLL